MISASLSNPNKMFIGVFGDLAFFYDMNVVGNRHVGNNVRILLINNGKGNEFRNYGHPCYFIGDEADKYIAAAGHYGNMSNLLVKNYAENLGYEYITASNKEDFNNVVEKFLSSETSDKPMLFEVFTETEDESDALETILNMVVDNKTIVKDKLKKAVKEIVGQRGIETIKKVIK